MRKAITEIMEGQKKKVTINSLVVKKYLGSPIYSYDDLEKDPGFESALPEAVRPKPDRNPSVQHDSQLCTFRYPAV